MQGFIVMQGQNYEEEKELGFIWTPQKDRSGSEQHSWERVREVKEGDRIFHYVKGDIVAISVAKTDCTIEKKPTSKKSTQGYLVQLAYYEFEKPLTIQDYFDKISLHLPKKYSPFQQDSSGNQGYLYPCNEALLIKLVELIGDLNIYEEVDEQLEFALGIVKRTAHNPLIPLLAETESAAKTKVRIEKKKFKQALLHQWHSKCAICEIDLLELLKASHAKPWKDSTKLERVNKYNGILFCANHAELYNRGFIAFDGQGKIHISSLISEENYEKYAIHAKVKIARVEENKYYFKWHKRNLFIK